MTIRIHEADGTPYEHVLDIRAPFKRYEVPFNTKYKRVRRNTKRYLARQAAAQAAAEGDAEAAEAIGMIDMGFGLEIWEKEQERENWKVADWTEEDEAIMSGATYEWIRMDADFEWIANIKFDQPDFMWVSQLQRDRDVVAQLEVCWYLFVFVVTLTSRILGATCSSGKTYCNRFEYANENSPRLQLLLSHPLRSCSCPCDSTSSLYLLYIMLTMNSVRYGGWTSLASSISSSCSFAIAMTQRIPVKTYSPTIMCPNPTISLTLLNTLSERCEFIDEYPLSQSLTCISSESHNCHFTREI